MCVFSFCCCDPRAGCIICTVSAPVCWREIAIHSGDSITIAGAPPCICQTEGGRGGARFGGEQSFSGPLSLPHYTDPSVFGLSEKFGCFRRPKASRIFTRYPARCFLQGPVRDYHMDLYAIQIGLFRGGGEGEGEK